MKITIITIVRNGEQFIERTIKSVLRQNIGDIEYIVIDGASTDGTLHAIKQYRDQIAIVVSEPDKGISDAWNKGLARASGDVIGLLNAGDEYCPDTVSKAVEAIVSGADLIFGDTELIDSEGALRAKNVGRFHLWKYSGGLGFYHPSCFARKALYDQIGGFEIGLRYAMDTDWILRAKNFGAVIRHAPITVRMLDDGVSVQNRFRAYGEYLHCLKKNGVADRVVWLSMLSTALRGLARGMLKGKC